MTVSDDERPWLDVAALGAVAAVALALVGQVVLAGGPSSRPDDFVLLLAATGALCVVGLTRRRNAAAAWLAIIAAFTMASLDLVATIRTNPAPIEPAALRDLVLVACLEALGATFVAAIYATRRSRRLGPWVPWVAAAGIAVVGLYAIVLIGADAMTGSMAIVGSGIGFVNRTVLVVVALLTILGVLGDLRPAVRRTRLRLEMEGLGDQDRAPGRAGRAGAIFLDEIAPGRTRAHRAAADERTRIAADLHAQVVPAVRRALDEAEHGGSPDRLVASLRTVLADVDALAAERHSITLDALGLVPAIEQLAERTEERSDVRITIDVVGGATPPAGPSDEGSRPPRTVEAAALRIAQLALENVVRHAPSATVRVEVAADPASVRLVVADDGPGFAMGSGESAAAAGRRGLVDMRMAAEACGGSLAAAPGDGGGAVVTFSWPPAAQVAAQAYGLSRKARGGTSAIPS